MPRDSASDTTIGVQALGRNVEDALVGDVLTYDGSSYAQWETPAGGGSSPPDLCFFALATTGPPAGTDGSLPLVPMATGLGGGVAGKAIGYTSWGVPITIGAGGGFAIDIEVAQAFLTAHPSLTLDYMEMTVTNADGTQKLLTAISNTPPFHNVSTWAQPNWSLATFSTYETVGADLSFDDDTSFFPGYPGVVSAAGGQYFASLFIQLANLT